MKLLSWNIQHGGGSRTAVIVSAIRDHDPDVIALAEYRTKPGVPLCGALVDSGWKYIEGTNPTGSDNGICVLSRTPLRRMPGSLAPPENAARWLDLDLTEHGFGLGVLHILTAVPGMNEVAGAAKTRFWNAVLSAAEARCERPFLFMGDLNTGAHYRDEERKTFVCAEHFERLTTLGWTDVWRHFSADITEYTWYSKFKGGTRGNGFRLDHAFVTPSLLRRVRGCRYSHREREERISDHSILIVEME